MFQPFGESYAYISTLDHCRWTVEINNLIWFNNEEGSSFRMLAFLTQNLSFIVSFGNAKHLAVKLSVPVFTTLTVIIRSTTSCKQDKHTYQMRHCCDIVTTKNLSFTLVYYMKNWKLSDMIFWIAILCLDTCVLMIYLATDCKTKTLLNTFWKTNMFYELYIINMCKR